MKAERHSCRKKNKYENVPIFYLTGKPQTISHHLHNYGFLGVYTPENVHTQNKKGKIFQQQCQWNAHKEKKITYRAILSAELVVTLYNNRIEPRIVPFRWLCLRMLHPCLGLVCC